MVGVFLNEVLFCLPQSLPFFLTVCFSCCIKDNISRVTDELIHLKWETTQTFQLGDWPLFLAESVRYESKKTSLISFLKNSIHHQTTFSLCNVATS